MAGLFALVLALACGLAPVAAQSGTNEAEVTALRPLVNALTRGSFDETQAQIKRLAETGNPAVVPVLEALGDGDLHERKSDGMAVIAKRSGSTYALTDPLTGADLGQMSRGGVDKIRVNNRLRRVIRAALGALTLRAPDPSERLAAARRSSRPPIRR